MLDIIKFNYENISKIILIFVIFLFINEPKLINIDNLIIESFYQKDLDFSQYNPELRVLAIYYPENHNNIIDYNDKKTISSLINRKRDNNIKKSLIEQQVRLAKNHGIFGFGIVYDWIDCSKLNEEIIDLFFADNMNNFPFFIILNNYLNFIPKMLMNINIKKYFKSENYIKFRGKFIIGVFISSYSLQIIKYIRQNEFFTRNTSVYIISIFNPSIDFEYMNSTYSFVEFPSKEIWMEKNLSIKYFYNYYYYNLFIKENSTRKDINNFFIINGCNPEKFYIIFKKLLNLTNHEKDRLLLINAWNNYQNNFYLEPNKEFGFSYLNYFSKALFNLNDDATFDLEILKNKCKIAIQVHLFYEDLITDIINKTNNIPVKFDLFISIIHPGKYTKIMNYIKNLSKANHFELLNFENKGRDVLPFLNQMKIKFKFYKYLCHLHTKKTKKIPEIGFLWRNYLFNNLLGNENIISQILNDFEKNNKLGFIFPETFFGIIKYFYKLTKENKKWMDFLVSKLLPNCKIGNQLNYPAGNMFWGKTAAIYQIFIKDLSGYFPKEINQTDDTIMHGIERIWLYLVKYNHYYYKVIFKFF